MSSTKRPVIIGVMGGGTATPEVSKHAEQLGGLIAEWGAILLCGGGSGVMEAAARGAKAHRPPGKTIGILPGTEPARANPHIDLALATGLRDARNYINVVTSDVLVALEGGPGTLSEIALGLKVGTPVIGLAFWKFLAEASFAVHCVDTPEAAIDRAFALANCKKGETTERPMRLPDFPSQTRNRDALIAFVNE